MTVEEEILKKTPIFICGMTITCANREK